MTVQLSTTVVNAMLDALETAIGPGAIIKIRSGAQPANCAAADSGTVLATFPVIQSPDVDWMAAASGGSKAANNLPLTDTSADNTGTAGHFRIYASNGTTCHWQGSVTATGGGGDMTVDNTSIAAAQQVSITALTINMSGHA